MTERMTPRLAAQRLLKSKSYNVINGRRWDLIQMHDARSHAEDEELEELQNLVGSIIGYAWPPGLGREFSDRLHLVEAQCLWPLEGSQGAD